MPTETECRHGMTPAFCADCTGRGLEDPTAAHADGPTIQAMYDGTCAHCSGHTRPGDSITRSEEAGGWCHTSCTDREPRPAKRVRNDIDLSEF